MSTRCRHCEVEVLDNCAEHPGLCCECFDLSCGVPLELLNEERADKGRPPITKPWRGQS